MDPKIEAIDGSAAEQGRRPGWPRSRYVLRTEQFIPRPPEEVFDFFSDAHNLNQITPPWLHFKILTPRPIAMHRGTLIDYSIRLRLVPIRWRTEISVWEPPTRFVDEQLKGPYTLWHHEHSFEPRDGGTLMRDTVTYALPMGWSPISRLVHRWMVGPDLQRVFAYRREVMARSLGQRRGVAEMRRKETWATDSNG